MKKPRVYVPYNAVQNDRRGVEHMDDMIEVSLEREERQVRSCIVCVHTSIHQRTRREGSKYKKLHSCWTCD